MSKKTQKVETIEETKVEAEVKEEIEEVDGELVVTEETKPKKDWKKAVGIGVAIAAGIAVMGGIIKAATSGNSVYVIPDDWADEIGERDEDETEEDESDDEENKTEEEDT